MANTNQTIGDATHPSSASSTQGDTPASAQISTSPELADSSSLSSSSSPDIPTTNTSPPVQDSSPPPQYLDDAESTTAPDSLPDQLADTDINPNDVVGTITVTTNTRQLFYLNQGPDYRQTTSIISIVRPSAANRETQRLAAYYDARAREFRAYRRRLAVFREARHRPRSAWVDHASYERDDELYEEVLAGYNVPSGVDIGLGEVIELLGRDEDMPEWI